MCEYDIGNALKPVSPLEWAKRIFDRNASVSPYVSVKDLNRQGGGDHDPSDPKVPAIEAGIRITF